jgi:hypothetical protein
LDTNKDPVNLSDLFDEFTGSTEISQLTQNANAISFRYYTGGEALYYATIVVSKNAGE